MSKQTILSDLDELVALAVRLKQAVTETNDSPPGDVSDLVAQLKVLDESFHKDRAEGNREAHMDARRAIEQGDRMKAHRHAADIAQGLEFIGQNLAAYKAGLASCYGNLHRGA